MNVVGSLVLYQNPPKMVEEAIESFLGKSYDRKLVIVDHSPLDNFSYLADSNIHYYHNPSNPGYGSGHNIAFKLANNPDYFFILNPDIIIKDNTIDILVDKLNNNSMIGLITGKILNSDGSIQKLLKNDPTIAALMARRFPELLRWKYFSKAENNFLLDDTFYKIEGDIPIISGCFMGMRGEVFSCVGGFDESYFLYFEDFDLCRRIRKLGLRVVYSPQAEIIHHWKRDSHKSIHHLWYFGRSMVRYFFN